MKTNMKTKKLSLLVLFLMIIMGLTAQKFDVGQRYPVDKDVVIGRLSNGLTYYIRQNAEPKDRAQFWLVVNAGSILEDPDQNGLAHFIEHMCFNGTKNFEKDQIIRYLQSIGMKFGPEINAFTSHDVTNYMLQNVPLEKPANIDTALLILYDWAWQVSLEDVEIDKERGVIHEEWRTGMGSSRRIRNAYFRTLFEGSKYATHDVIGDMNIVDHFQYDVLKRFYKDWYRPDLQAIIAVGDFDVKMMEEKITGLFSQIPKVDNPRTRILERIPDHDQTKVSIVTDEEARMMQLMILYKHPAIMEKSTLSYSRNTLKENLYNAMLSARLNELVQQADPPFIMAMSAYRGYVRSSDMYMMTAYLNNPDPSRALAALVRENLRVLQHGFTQTELDRAKAEYLASMEKQYNERNNRKSETFAWEYYGHFLNNEPVPGIQFEYDMTREFIPSITLSEVNALAHNWITDKNRVVVLTAPQDYAEKLPKEETLLQMIMDIEKEPVEAYVDAVSAKPLHNLPLKAGKVKKARMDDKAGCHEWILSNGATVIIKPTKFKEDEILFSAYSKGGTSLYDDADLLTAQSASTITDMSGISEFNTIELSKILADKMVRISPYIGGLEEGLSGSTTPKDLVTLLELLNLYFLSPRTDEQSFNSYMSRQRALLLNKAKDPASAFSDTLTNTLYNYHPRRRPMNVEMLDEIDFHKMAAIFSKRFSNAGDWTFYFVGNIDPETAKPLIEKYIGSIPAAKKRENWKDRQESIAKGVIRKQIHTQMQIPKATVFVLQGGEFSFDPRERMLLSFINDILDVKYTQIVREQEGGTYGVSVQTSINQLPSPTYHMTAYFTCAPERVDDLTKIIYQQVDVLKKEGPTQQEVDNVIENKLKERAEDLKENRFWLRSLKFMYENNQDFMDANEYAKMVKSITINDVREAARKYYEGANVIEVIQLPQE